MAATLKHAQPVLAAASAAGFRESGLQSLKNLDDADAFPIVAVRTSGLALESIIGIRESNGDDYRTSVRRSSEIGALPAADAEADWPYSLEMYVRNALTRSPVSSSS